MIWRAFYGSKSEIQRWLAKYQDKQANLKNLYRSPSQTVEPNEPFGVSDATIALRFALDVNAGGLYFPRMQTKQNIMGFYNPIPPFKKEYENPVLCVVYTLGERAPSMGEGEFVAPKTLHIDYYSDKQEVKIVCNQE